MSRTPNWSTAHELLVERARRLEVAVKTNRMAADARVILHTGDLGIVQTERDFAAEVQRAREAGGVVDPRFKTWVDWERTADEFHSAFRAMYPPDEESVIQALAAGDLDTVEWALVFLEANPQCFRAGYLRERMLRYLARILDGLSEADRARLTRVVLAAVDDPWRPATYRLPDDPLSNSRRGRALLSKVGASLDQRLSEVQRREFGWYCRLAAKLSGHTLQRDLEDRVRSDDPVVARRASLMLGAMARKQEPAQQA